MKLEGYLSEEELMQLILDVEENDLVSAPVGLLDSILKEVETLEESKIISSNSKENKTKEFQRYCIRVITSVAAAIAIVFLTPNVGTVKGFSMSSRQELVGKSITREEALKETGLINRILNLVENQIGGLLNETEKKE